MRIRPAELADAERMAVLCGELGYPALAADVEARYRRACGRDEAVFVAVTGDSRVIGWIHAGIRDLLISLPRVEILGLVVDRAARQRGAGRALVEAVEAWARSQGVAEMVVRSGVERAESHPFYEHLGYRRYKSQHVYLKRIAGEST